MPVLSYVHHLFNVDQCQAYVHTLRWKNRSPQWPRCQSYDVDPWGTYHYRPGCKRYWCDGCKRTFNDLTKPSSTRVSGRWRTGFSLPACCACRARLDGLRESWGRMAVRVIAGAGGCANWALDYGTDRQLADTVEADDLYHTAGQKGQVKQGGKRPLGRRPRGRRKKREPGRGHYDKDRPAIIAWVSRQGAVVIHATRDFTVKTVQKAADLAVQTGSRLYTDSASSYRAVTGYIHEFVNHTKKEYARGEVHENRAECLFSLLKPY